MNKKKLILFDVDGVILDSKSNMNFAWKAVQDAFSINTTFKEYFENIGRPFSEIMKILGHSDKSDVIEKVYKNASLKNFSNIKFYSGTKSSLKSLLKDGYKLGVVTSKDKERTEFVLEKLGVDFSVIRTPDNICRGKPSPDHLLYAMAVSNIDPSDTVFIGDMDVDYMAAINAGIDYIHAEWGYSPNINYDVPKLKSFPDIVRYLKSENI